MIPPYTILLDQVPYTRWSDTRLSPFPTGFRRLAGLAPAAIEAVLILMPRISTVEGVESSDALFEYNAMFRYVLEYLAKGG